MYSAEELKLAAQKIGLPRNSIQILKHLAAADGAAVDTIALERATMLRQPEISHATSRLFEMGLITAENYKQNKIGRAVKIYSMAPLWTEIMTGMLNKEIESIKGPIEHFISQYPQV